jgi:hypothetical protein
MAFLIYKDDYGDEFGVEYHFEGVHIRQTLEHPAEYPDLIIDSYYKLDDNKEIDEIPNAVYEFIQYDA